MTIREATVADLDEIVALGLLFLESPAYAAHITGHPDIMRATATRLIVQDDGVLFVSVDRGGSVTGMIGVIVFLHHLSGDLIAGELMWFVHPDYRGGGMRLFAQARAWAQAQGATQLQMLQPVCEAQLTKIYTAEGGQPIETAWQFAL